MIKIFYNLVLFSTLLGVSEQPVTAQVPSPLKKEEIALESNKVQGLELPPDQTVNFDEGFINIQAQCKGEVKWLVISSVKIKFVQIPNNALIISVPPQQTTITVFAVGLVDGKQTEFARTNIQINGGTNPAPVVGANPGVPKGPLHVTFVVDMNQTTPEIAQMLNSQTLRQGITSRGNFFRIYDIKSPVIKQKKLDIAIANLGNASIIVQQNDGTILMAQSLPRNEQEILQIVNRLTGQ